MSDEGATSWWERKGRRQVAWLLGYAVVFGLIMAVLLLSGQQSVVLAACASAVFVLGCSYNLCNAETRKERDTGSSRYSGVLEALIRGDVPVVATRGAETGAGSATPGFAASR